MKRFAWSAVSFFDNDLKMGTIAAATHEDALLYALSTINIECQSDDCMDSDSIKEFAFDCEALVEAIEI